MYLVGMRVNAGSRHCGGSDAHRGTIYGGSSQEYADVGKKGLAMG